MAKTKKAVMLAKEELAAAVAAGRGFKASSATAPSSSAGSAHVASSHAAAAAASAAAAAPAADPSGGARKRIRSKSAPVPSNEKKKVKLEQPERGPVRREPVPAAAAHAAATPAAAPVDKRPAAPPAAAPVDKRPAVAPPAAAPVDKRPAVAPPAAPESFDRSEMVRHPKPAEGEYEVLWENIHHVMDRYDLTEAEATAVLMTVLGPDSAGETFWTKYKARVKKEQADMAAMADLEAQKKHEASAAEIREPQPKRPRLDPSEREVPDNQLGDPDLYPSEEAGDDDDLDGEHLDPATHGDVGPNGFVDGEETEEDEDEDDEEVEVPANGGGDDQDSPASGAAQVEAEAEEVIPEPTEPAEPVRVRVEMDETVEAAKKSLPRDLKLKDVPSPSRSHARVPQVEDLKNPGQFRSLLFLGCAKYIFLSTQWH